MTPDEVFADITTEPSPEHLKNPERWWQHLRTEGESDKEASREMAAVAKDSGWQLPGKALPRPKIVWKAAGRCRANTKPDCPAAAHGIIREAGAAIPANPHLATLCSLGTTQASGNSYSSSLLYPRCTAPRGCTPPRHRERW